MMPMDYEIEYRDLLNRELPSSIIDAHVHASEASHFDIQKAQNILNKSASTFPETTIEQSQRIDALLHPGMNVQKLRFAHAFAGIDHKAVNEYLIEQSPERDKVALFGVSENDEEIEYTRENLLMGKYSALKMYYCSSGEEKLDLYDYFPKAVLDIAQKVDLPIILHLPKTVSGSMNELKMLVDDYPRLRIMLAHIGVTWTHPSNFNVTMAEIASFKNVFVDTSGVTNSSVIQTAIEHLGYERVLYGSDEPLNLLREFTYVNPSLGPRLLTDYPYHWVDQEEYEANKHLLPENLMYCELQQVDALLVAIRGLASVRFSDMYIQSIFHDNAKREFNF
jgi:predicted TIM-barrel fold metal-dependent hydrolase